jgi:hypothetical protein
MGRIAERLRRIIWTTGVEESPPLTSRKESVPVASRITIYTNIG